MKQMMNVKSIAGACVVAVIMAACGGGGAAVSIAQLPVYAGASELQPGDSAIAATLKNNEAQAAASGQKIEQKGYSLPGDASWDSVIAFYKKELTAQGWKDGVGAGAGIAGAIAGDMAAKALAQANAGNDLFKTAMFSKGKQTLTVIRLVSDPSKKNEAQLLLSLNTR